MALTPEKKRKAAKRLAKEIFEGILDQTADLDLDNLMAAVDSIDATMDLLPNDPILDQTKSLKTNFVQQLPQPFKGNANAQEKAIALSVWAMVESGLIT